MARLKGGSHVAGDMTVEGTLTVESLETIDQGDLIFQGSNGDLTLNKIPKASDVDKLEDSIIEDDGSIVTVNGELTATEDYLIPTKIINKRKPGIDSVVIPKGIYEEYTNLVQDPCDLTTGNWTTVNGVTATLTDITVKGHKLTKLEIDGTHDPQIKQGIVCSDTETNKVAYFLLRNGNMTGLTEVYVVQPGASAFVKGHSVVDWANKSITTSDGELLESNWLDDNTVELWLSTETGESGHTTWQYRIDPNNAGDGHGGEYIYATACMLVDDTTTMFPFVDGTHTKDEISESFTLPDKFTFDMIIEPKFSYDVTADNYFFEFHVNSSVFRCYFEEGIDKIAVVWVDGGTARYLASQQLDDGSSYTNINQRFRIIGSVDLTTGTTAGSRFILIPLESGSILEDITWTGNIDVKSTNFNTIYIGNNLTGGAQADSDYEYLRFYSGTLSGDINKSSDADKLLQDKSMIFEAIPDAFVAREIKDNTPISVALQNIYDDFKTGVGIRDGAILNRHLQITSEKIDNLNADLLDGAQKDTDGTLGGNSDSSIPTEKAVKSYVDAHANGTGASHTYINQDVTTTASPTFASVNTGQGANELYAMNQNVRTTDSVTFASVNTGHGANELYAMNQNVRTTDSVTFASVNTGYGANEVFPVPYFFDRISGGTLPSIQLGQIGFCAVADRTCYLPSGGTYSYAIISGKTPLNKGDANSYHSVSGGSTITSYDADNFMVIYRKLS